MQRVLLNRIASVAGIILAAAMFVAARGFPERAAPAARYVFFLSGALGLLCLLLLIQTWFLAAKDAIEWIKAPLFFSVTAAGMVVYVAVLPFLGFFISSFIFMSVIGWILGVRKPIVLFGGTAGLLLFIYEVFVSFLTVPVPVGVLGV